MDFHRLFDLIKSSKRSYDVLLEIFLVHFNARTAVLVNLENKDAIAYLEENNFQVVPYMIGINNYFVWSKTGRFHERNLTLIHELEKIVKENKEELIKNTEFHTQTGKLLNYMTPLNVSNSKNRKIGKSVSILVSFDLPEGTTTSLLYKFPKAPKNGARAPITWTNVTSTTHHCELYPQFVFDKTDIEIEEFFKPCLEILKDKSLQSLLPFPIRSVFLKNKPHEIGLLGGGQRKDRQKSLRRQQQKRVLRHRRVTLRRR